MGRPAPGGAPAVVDVEEGAAAVGAWKGTGQNVSARLRNCEHHYRGIRTPVGAGVVLPLAVGAAGAPDVLGAPPLPAPEAEGSAERPHAVAAAVTLSP